MKKYFSLLLVVFGLLLCCNSLLNAQVPDPSGKLDELITLENQQRDAVLEFVNTIVFDYHPVYGKVGIGDLPVSPTGFNESQIPTLFPGEAVVNYEIIKDTVSGVALVEHKAADGTRFYVWHRMVNEPIYEIYALTADEGNASLSSTNMTATSNRLQNGVNGPFYPNRYITVIGRCTNGMYLIIDEFGFLRWVHPWEIRHPMLY